MIHFGAAQHSFLLPESKSRPEYSEAPIPRALLAFSCRNRGRAGMTISRGGGSHSSSVGNSTSSNCRRLAAGGIITRKPSSSTKCAKSCACATNGRRSPVSCRTTRSRRTVKWSRFPSWANRDATAPSASPRQIVRARRQRLRTPISRAGSFRPWTQGRPLRYPQPPTATGKRADGADRS